MNGRFNVEIRNGTIKDFGSHGIFAENPSSHSHRGINVRVMNNKGHGIHLIGSNYMVKDCNVSNNGGYGITVGAGSTVKNNTSHYNQREGIYLGSYSLVDGNTAYQNNQAGGYSNISACATCVFGDNLQ